MQSVAIFSEERFLQNDNLISVAFSEVKYFLKMLHVLYIHFFRIGISVMGKLKSQRNEIFYVELFNF